VIAIYLSENYFTDNTPTFQDATFNLCYHDLISRILNLGAEVILARDAEKNYLADFQFKTYFATEIHHQKIHFREINNQPREFHLLYNKGRFPLDIPRRVNSLKLATICHDKYLSYLFAPDFHAHSFLLRDETDLETFTKTYFAKNIALKELSGYGGTKVFVGQPKNYQHNLQFPLLAQEFIDTSNGFANFARDVHDIRVGLFNGEPICGLVREPRTQNELRTNFHLGGRTRELYLHEIPSELIAKTRELDTRFQETSPRFFSADWGFDKHSRQWKLFEINESPGLSHESVDGPAANEFMQLLADKLVESAKRNV